MNATLGDLGHPGESYYTCYFIKDNFYMIADVAVKFDVFCSNHV